MSGAPAPATTLTPEALSALRCPSCADALELQRVSTPPDGRGTYGVLTCGCRQHPVIDDIAVLDDQPLGMTNHADGSMIIRGPAPSEVAERILAGGSAGVLARLLTMPPGPASLRHWRPARVLLTKSPLATAAAALRRPLTHRDLVGRRDDMTARDWFHRSYGRSAMWGDFLNHFSFRFEQPRMLAAMALIEALPGGSYVDIASGYGHLLHRIGAERSAFALDRSFLMLWVSRWYVAPHATHILGDATGTFPLASASVDLAICSDAFGFLADRARCLRQMQRVSRTGTAIVAPLTNRYGAGENRDSGVAIVRAGDGEHRIMSEDVLVDAYLAGQTADLASDGEGWTTAADGDLYAVVTRAPDVLVGPRPLPEPMPHRRGVLSRNPLYGQPGHDGRFRMPSSWYDQENVRLHDYLPIDAGDGVSQPIDLTSIGLPSRY